ncbi:MAG: hypothetical protein ABI837_13510 [Acidobacteriota bacterium]
MKISRTYLAWLSALLLSAAPILAEDPKPPENGTAAPAANATPAEAALFGGHITLNGYMNVESDYQPTEFGLGDKNASIDTDVMELLLNYKADDKFRVSAAIDYEHGTDTELGQGHLTTAWLFLEYAPSDRFKIRAGKFLVPFGYFNEIHGAKNLFLARDEAKTTLKPQKIAANGFRYAPKWETGLEALGRLPVGKSQSIEYLVVVGNGYQTETNPYEQDNNSKKSFTARAAYMPTDELTIGVSGYSDFLSQTTANKTNWGRLQSVGTFVKYSTDRWKLLYEVNQGRQRKPGAAATARELGQAAEVGYVMGRITPYVQVQTVSTHSGSANERANAIIAGFDYTVGRFVLKLQDAEWHGSDNKKFNFPGGRYNEVQAAVFYAF